MNRFKVTYHALYASEASPRQTFTGTAAGVCSFLDGLTVPLDDGIEMVIDRVEPV